MENFNLIFTLSKFGFHNQLIHQILVLLWLYVRKRDKEVSSEFEKMVHTVSGLKVKA